jgi:hypothetical protein
VVGDGRESDFAAFLAARWARVVRALVLLGGSRDEAQRVARDALARLRPGWERGVEDPDVRAWRQVLASWRERRWTGPPGASGWPRAASLEPRLDRLTPDARAALVLRAVAGLDPGQVDQVLGGVPAAGAGEVPDGAPGDDELRAAADEVVVDPAPSPAALAAGRERRSRLPAGLLAGATAAALVVGVGTWLGTRPPDRPDGAGATGGAGGVPRVSRVENAAEVAWWANGVLHLPHVDVTLPQVTGLVEIDDGAVYADRYGLVSAVSGDGVVTRIGRQAPDGRLVGSDDTGWAAWVDTSGDVPRLVVQDVTAGARLAALDLPVDAAVRPVALDRGTLYYTDREDHWQWAPGEEDPLRVLQPGLLDVADATEARQFDRRRVELVQPFFNLVRVVPGEGAELSPDATYALTRVPGTGRGDAVGDVRVYDVRSGDPLWTGLSRREVAVAATLGPDDEVHYVVAPRLHPWSSGRYELRTCHLGERTCFTVVRFAHTDAVPVLAH